MFKDVTTSKRRAKDAHPYKASSGTVKDKQGFCDRAIRSIETHEDLSAEAMQLCERMYAFIEAQNS